MGKRKEGLISSNFIVVGGVLVKFGFIFISLIFFILLAGIVSATNVSTFGDSYTDNVTYNSDYAHKYVSIVAANHSYTIDNKAHSGYTIQDQATIIRRYYSSPAIQIWWNSGVGDVVKYNSSAAGMECYNATLGSLLAWLAIPDGNKRVGSLLTQVSGSWSNAPIYDSNTITSKTPGSTLQGTVSGNTVYVCYIRINAPGTKKFDLYLDNHFIQTVDCLGGATVPVPGNEIYYSPKLIRFSGLNNTQHTVKVVINASTSDYTSIDWIAGFNSSNVTAAATKIYLINVPPYTDTDYAAISTDVNTTIAYNRMIRDTVNSLNRDGLNISLVDIFTGYNASTMSVPDGLHPNDAGNIFIAEKLETALPTPVTPETPGQNWIVSTINAFLNMLKNMGLHLGCVAWQT